MYAKAERVGYGVHVFCRKSDVLPSRNTEKGGGYRGYTQDTPVGRVFLPSSSNGECPSKAVSLSCNFPSSWNLVVCAAFSVVLLSVTQCTYLLYWGLHAYRVVVRRGE